jgi:hypothetical protein
MLQLADKTQEIVAPESAVLDRAHLARMTFNDPGLEREILQLFHRQAELLLNRHGSKRAARYSHPCAHTERVGRRHWGRSCRAGRRRNGSGSTLHATRVH